jgi:peptidoglycan/xylan/chitin deacetylase (PgdA/CDA1 family)
LEAALARARRPVHGAWALAASAAASALLLTAIGLRIGELVEVNSHLGPAAQPSEQPPELRARVASDDGPRRLVVEGVAGSRVLISDGDQPLKILTIGESGAAEMPLSDELGAPAILRVVLLATAEQGLELPPATPRAEPTIKLPSPTPPEVSIATATPSSTPPPSPRGRSPARSFESRSTALSAPPVLQLVRDAGPLIALTFDGNSSANRSSELLDVLQRLDLEVTLFVTGRFIDRYPGIIRRAILSGHEIGNHTYSHPHLTTYESNRRHNLRPGITREGFQAELRKTEAAFAAATGRSLQPLWRAPYGEENSTLRGWALEIGYLHVRWSSLDRASLDSRDWVADEHSSLYQSSSLIMERLLRFPELRGGLVLMHLSTDRPEPPWDELPTFVEELRRRGLQPTTVTQLIESSRTWRPWLRRAEKRHQETFERSNVQTLKR